MTHLCIGVVSHERTRFRVSQGPEGLAAKVAELLTDVGVDVITRVNTDDAGSHLGVKVTPRAVQESLSAQLSLDRRWAKFLGLTSLPKWWVGYALRIAQRSLRRFKRPPVGSIVRLLNIEVSHRELLRWGIGVGAEWILILEDDAMSSNPNECATGIAGLIRDASSDLGYVNLSESFTPQELGVDHLLSSVEGVMWSGSTDRIVYSAKLPITNTVCAILYRRHFAQALLKTLEALPVQPVVPIDWKLNEALMHMYSQGEAQAGACWIVEPAPILQMSMR